VVVVVISSHIFWLSLADELARNLTQGFLTLMAMTSWIMAGESERVLFVIQLNTCST
jgi:hypothetical protein